MSEFIHIVAPSAGVDLRCLMGDGPATPTGGMGGWQQVQRPDAKSLTEWSGQDTFTQSVPILINGWNDGNSVQGQANDILALGRNTEDDEVPPIFRISGAIHLPWLLWVLEDIEWLDGEDQVIRERDTTLMRQEVVLHIAEYEDPDKIRVKRKRHAFGTGKGGGTNAVSPGNNEYIVHNGDTCNKIAAKVYGDRTRGKVIAEKNDIRDPNKELKAGRSLRLPTNPWKKKDDD